MEKKIDRVVYFEEMRKKRVAAGPLHHFPDLLPSERLEYEKLSAENYLHLLPLFKEDESPFLDGRYKEETAAKENLDFVQDMVYDTKCGGCDFLIRLKGTQQYIGILHLFDYSLETFLDVPLRCTLGYAIAKPFRRHYFATEAIRHLIDYAHQNHGKRKFLVYTSIKNDPSNSLMQSLNFRLANDEYCYGEDGSDNFYVLEV
ncbi:MAG: hypothetical protein RLZZ292_935 [Bacteroidota bacterium]|jgi:RimJ/RimL family protein N-acetyltransferase